MSARAQVQYAFKAVGCLALAFVVQCGRAADVGGPPEVASGVLNSREVSPLALQRPLTILREDEQQRFVRGRALFSQLWVAAPSLDVELDGLGPTYNQSSCAACHLRNGRGQAPASPRERMRGMLLRLSVPGAGDDAGPLPHPVYGEQLQDAAISGVPAEGRAVLEWVEHEEQFSDGEVIRLRRPHLTLVDLAFGAPGGQLLLSPRVAPPLIGTGLLDAVSDATLQELAATPRPDGISGRINRVRNPYSGESESGRFGWKAGTVSLLQQTAAAFSGDLGITSTLFPQENCPVAQTACAAATFESPDLSDTQLADIVFFQAALAVPASRSANSARFARGRELFDHAGCQHCHLHQLRSSDSAWLPGLSGQTFAPYTDMLLHDLGEGLADGRPEHVADRREWRTAPLWGLGLIPLVNEHDTLLHDGRARGVLEAILWHGGEAELARERVRNMQKRDREVLVDFVNSL